MVRKFFNRKKNELEEFLRENRSYMMPMIIIGGFVIDNLTLRQIDRIFDNLVLIIHLLIVALTIAILFSSHTKLGEKLKIEDRKSTISAIMLFSFGGLFSGFVVFYSRSGSLISSWPFILAMLLLMLATEVKKEYYEKIILQITIFYIALFSYLIFSVPIIVKKMGPEIYILSGIVSLILIALYFGLLKKISRSKFKENRTKLFTQIVSTFVMFNLLYFTNIIPPIPLSLKFHGIYHDFSRVQSAQYSGFYEPSPAWKFWDKRSRVFHRTSGEAVYVYTQVYAPVNLSIDIYHKWEYFDPTLTRWVSKDQIRIPITGGRLEGYRGFSKKVNVYPGSWRVRVTTDRNQTLGQITFKIKNVDGPVELEKEVFN